MTEVNSVKVTGQYVTLDGESYYRIGNSHRMPDFFMSLVGASDHWMFVSSNGALTAGRCDPDSALFPYAADDQISSARSNTGARTLIRFPDHASLPAGERVWEPFVDHCAKGEGIRRNLYKTPLGNKLVFEEFNQACGLAFRYRWAFSETYGFVRTCRLTNLSAQSRRLELLDGLTNLLPSGLESEFILRFSNLANAYKKSELLAESGLALFYPSSIPTDRAEPSEGLKASTTWQTGLLPEAILLSSQQISAFRRGEPVHTEVDVRGQACAYLVSQQVELAAGESAEWHVVADVQQDHVDVIGLNNWLCKQSPSATYLAIAADIQAGEQDLLDIVSSADGLQCGSNPHRCNRHLSNTVFNVMRGGIPIEDYRVDAEDFRRQVATFNAPLAQRYQADLANLPASLDAAGLRSRLSAIADPDLTRLGLEYLPLAFSRRHGDPTRPWNRFAIRLRSENGRTNLDYQGNWRDIFQNWEALAFSFPEFSTAMICRFVNATTADGYNPYRLTKDGFEWEEPKPEDPWGNIGYWGDHQIIYLLKLLEWNRRIDPRELDTLLNQDVYVHANVPYRIKDFQQIKQNPQDTIEFDATLSATIADRVGQIGTDGKLLRNRNDQTHRVTLLEKLLILSLTKLSNFVPDGGIWLNTQRPEWNDANNALVGNGLSMVTACYLLRWFRFLQRLLLENAEDSYLITAEVAEYFHTIRNVLTAHSEHLDAETSPTVLATIVESLSHAASDYRHQLYFNGVTGQTTQLSREECLQLFAIAERHLAATIGNNRRPDGLFHAYNLMRWRDEGIEIEHLYEMLEGQVAVLSSGFLSAAETVELLDALRGSSLYRKNQNSYLLYPDRQLPRFLEKNEISAAQVAASPLLTRLLDDGNKNIVHRDVCGNVHFNGNFRNSSDLKEALNELPGEYSAAAQSEVSALAELFEQVFGHRRFTGRSGTFFAYEGLGSIYWHMVSKLLLAVSEVFFRAVDNGDDPATVDALKAHYESIRSGIGAEKSPSQYGAFPSDPYSHTPENAGVKQPGMTGQVKEDILSRFAEIGLHVEDGGLRFRLDLFDRRELLDAPREFTFCDRAGQSRILSLPAGSFACSMCQVPIIIQAGDREQVQIQYTDQEAVSLEGLKIDADRCRKLFSRSGQISEICCTFTPRRGK